MPKYIVLFLTLIIGLKSVSTHAQKPLNEPVDKGPKSKIELIRADSLVGINGQDPRRTFYGKVKFFHRGVYLNCRKAIHNSGSNNLVAYGDIFINQGDTLTITGDTLYYDGNTRMAKIQGKKVILTDDDLTLESRRMEYDLNNDLAYYPVPGIIHQDSVILTSNKGYYNTETKLFNYIGNVEILHPDFVLCTDTLDYDSNTKKAVFNSFTTINSPDGNLSAYKGYYYTDTKISKFYGRSFLENEDYTLSADTLDFDLEIEEGFGRGNVEFFSKADSLVINGDYGEKLSSKGYTKITGNTLMKSISDGDTLFMRADYIIAYNSIDSVLKKPMIKDTLEDVVLQTVNTDSLLSSTSELDSLLSDSLETKAIHADSLINQLPSIKTETSLTNSPTLLDTIITDTNTIVQNSADSLNSIEIKDTAVLEDSSKIDASNDGTKMEFIIANGNVKIYRDDFQALCDSLNYNLVDSTITFISNPMIWSTDNQLEGDTIEAIMVNNKIRKMLLKQNGFVIAADSSDNFNQIKGRDIIAYFDSLTNIERVVVDGNGESIYFALDEQNKLIGLNRVECSKMRLNFIDRKVKRIAFMGSPESKLIPPREIGQNEVKLPNFSWEIDRKPTKNEVLGLNFAEDIVPSKTEDNSDI
ncbi:OstA-like protein [Jiulongibacter sp. NS-SX5]|uniref:OstA-like protein n=1 Tax=Jiulongibacter sp. NS-SX5 TaxID=3463854 RepID=UPI004057F937